MWIIVGLLAFLGVLGMVTGHTLGGVTHLMLVIAFVMALVRMVTRGAPS